MMTNKYAEAYRVRSALLRRLPVWSDIAEELAIGAGQGAVRRGLPRTSSPSSGSQANQGGLHRAAHTGTTRFSA